MSNISNSTELWIESIIARLGFAVWISSDNLTFVLIPNILGMISEAACLIVFCQIKNSVPLFTYLKACAINNFLISACFFFQFFYGTYYLGDARVKVMINAHLVVPFQGCAYLYSTLLDILILLDGLSTFNNRVRYWTQLLSPYKKITLLGVISIICTIPYFFLYSPVNRTFISPNGSVQTVWIGGTSILTGTDTGYALIVLVLTIDYVLVMMAQIILNICSVLYIRKHLREKKALVGTRRQSYQNVDLKMSLMVTMLCVISFAEHMLLVSSYIGLFFFRYRFNVPLLQRITFMSFGIRRLCDFFFYFMFNKVFRKQVLVTVGLIKDTRVHSGGSTATLNKRNGR